MVAVTGRNETITGVCRKCQESHTLLVDIKDLQRWATGSYIQDVMSYLSADERELLISHTCGKCWDEMFGDCEE